MPAGAAGHTYGHNPVWQMGKPGLPSVIHASIPWMQALRPSGRVSDGAFAAAVRVAAVAGAGAGPVDDPQRDGDGAGDDPGGKPFTVNRAIIKADRVKEIWWDPRYGVAHHVHPSDNQALQPYVPPTSGRGQDWLILEDEAARFPLPGL